VLKTLGYVCKFLVALDEANAPRFKNVGTKCSEARRMFWLGRSIAEYKTLRELLAKRDNSITWLTGVISRAGFMFRYVFENYIILSKCGLFKPENLNEVVRICSKFWFIAVFFGFVTNVIKLVQKQLALGALQDLPDKPETREKKSKLESERDGLVYTCISQVGDVSNASTGSNAIQTVLGITPSARWIGFWGSLGGIMQVRKGYMAT